MYIFLLKNFHFLAAYQKNQIFAKKLGNFPLFMAPLWSSGEKLDVSLITSSPYTDFCMFLRAQRAERAILL
jgi:hypothetical protein